MAVERTDNDAVGSVRLLELFESLLTMVSDDVETISREFARALGKASARSGNLRPESIFSKYDEIEASFLPRLSGHPDLVIEIRRRVAEMKLFDLLADKIHRPYEDVGPYYDATHRLGFTNLESEATIEISFARYCLKSDHAGKAKEILEKLSVKLDRALESEDLALYRQLRQTVETILQKL